MAQAKNQGTPAFDLYKDAQYDAAAARGLTDLLMQPWNHELRLMVADSHIVVTGVHTVFILSVLRLRCLTLPNS